MSTKMNSNTHKVIVARYNAPETIYAVPIDWDLEKVCIRYGVFYYDGEKVYPPRVELETCGKFPMDIEETDELKLEEFFDCEEDSEEEAETNQS